MSLDKANNNVRTEKATQFHIHGLPLFQFLEFFVTVIFFCKKETSLRVCRRGAATEDTCVLHTSCIRSATGSPTVHRTPLVTFNAQFEKWLRLSDAHEFLGCLDVITGNHAVQFLSPVLCAGRLCSCASSLLYLINYCQIK